MTNCFRHFWHSRLRAYPPSVLLLVETILVTGAEQCGHATLLYAMRPRCVSVAMVVAAVNEAGAHLSAAFRIV